MTAYLPHDLLTPLLSYSMCGSEGCGNLYTAAQDINVGQITDDKALNIRAIKACQLPAQCDSVWASY